MVLVIGILIVMLLLSLHIQVKILRWLKRRSSYVTFWGSSSLAGNRLWTTWTYITWWLCGLRMVWSLHSSWELDQIQRMKTYLFTMVNSIRCVENLKYFFFRYQNFLKMSIQIITIRFDFVFFICYYIFIVCNRG